MPGTQHSLLPPSISRSPLARFEVTDAEGNSGLVHSDFFSPDHPTTSNGPSVDQDWDVVSASAPASLHTSVVLPTTRQPDSDQDLSDRQNYHSSTVPRHSPRHWGWLNLSPRPRHRTVKRIVQPPDEHKGQWERTRLKVAEAAFSILDFSKELAHQGLLVGVEILPFVPVPGLAAAAQILLSIWDSVQEVQTDQLACFRITERCANVLISLRPEIARAGKDVIEELKVPIQQLERSLLYFRDFAQELARQPFLRRFLKHDDILNEIRRHDQALEDCLYIFNISIQLRMFKRLLERSSNNDRLGPEVPLIFQPATNDPEPLDTDLDIDVMNFPAHITSSETPDLPSLTGQFRTIRDSENKVDQARDLAHLARILQEALESSNDEDTVKVLQIVKTEYPMAIEALQRALDSLVQSTSTTRRTISLSRYRPNRSPSWPLDAAEARELALLSKEFIESEIDALKRISQFQLDLPCWTITKNELKRGKIIHRGFFSDVYEGTWRRQKVAIKVLGSATPRQMFVDELLIWKSLRHPNILELYGASRTTGDPPWFFVAPLLGHGNLSDYLKDFSWRMSFTPAASHPTEHNGMLLRMMLDVAEGMHFLHDNGIIHGDLRASNVLVDAQTRCIVTDFGHSTDTRRSIWRARRPTRRSLRWQAPELMTGQSFMSLKTDVYAFGICCTEVLNLGVLPWPMIHEDEIKRRVLSERSRPDVNPTIVSRLGLQDLLQLMWHHDSSQRPVFTHIVDYLGQLSLPYASSVALEVSHNLSSVSSDLRSRLPAVISNELPVCTSPSNLQGSSNATDRGLVTPAEDESRLHRLRPTRSYDSLPVTSEGLSLLTQASQPASEPQHKKADAKNERRYRLIMSTNHRFCRSLVLALWTPCPVRLGAVGYLSKPSGKFVTLFNAFDPPYSSHGALEGMASLTEFGQVTTSSKQLATPATEDRSVESSTLVDVGLTPPSQRVLRRHSFQTIACQKSAYLCVEMALHQFIQELDIASNWFQNNIARVLEVYGRDHLLHQEDLLLVTGTLNAPDWALFVNHDLPDGHLHFDAFSHRIAGQPWGKFSFEQPLEIDGAQTSRYPSSMSASKISLEGSPWDTVLLSRLRFQSDNVTPVVW